MSAANVVAQVNSGLYAPVATAFVTADNATVYRQPGQTAVGAMEKGELVAVLGQNAGGDWLYILTTNQLQGWLPQTSLHLVGALEQAPVLPPNPLAAAASAAISTTTAAPPAAPLTDLKPVTSAQVKSDGLNMRQGRVRATAARTPWFVMTRFPFWLSTLAGTGHWWKQAPHRPTRVGFPGLSDGSRRCDQRARNRLHPNRPTVPLSSFSEEWGHSH